MNSAIKTAYTVLALLLIVSMVGCCRRKPLPTPGQPVIDRTSTSTEASTEAEKDGKVSQSEDRPLDILANTGLSFSVDGNAAANKGGSPGSFFEQKYLAGIEYMEKGEFSEAYNIFNEIISRYPGTEEASIAELCIAEMHFRNRANRLAMQAYEKIVADYPNTHAAQNAKAGISYLRDFEKYESEYVSPDVEARRRKGF